MTKPLKPVAKRAPAPSGKRAKPSAPPANAAPEINTVAIASLAAAAKRSAMHSLSEKRTTLAETSPPAIPTSDPVVANASVPAPTPAPGLAQASVPAPAIASDESTCRALEPALEVQQQVALFEQLARHQGAFINDCVQLGLSQLSAGLRAHTPVEFTLTSTALATQFSARAQMRWREWITFGNASQQLAQQLFTRAAARLADNVQRAF